MPPTEGSPDGSTPQPPRGGAPSVSISMARVARRKTVTGNMCAGGALQLIMDSPNALKTRGKGFECKYSIKGKHWWHWGDFGLQVDRKVSPRSLIPRMHGPCSTM
mmetsp:Transcript_621/g.1279  ORF Transcript_621/g.1279 Transcript_621/m.1279 type:complete len:105 (+) Transcript_621:938-1252(+)